MYFFLIFTKFISPIKSKIHPYEMKILCKSCSEYDTRFSQQNLEATDKIYFLLQYQHRFHNKFLNTLEKCSGKFVKVFYKFHGRKNGTFTLTQYISHMDLNYVINGKYNNKIMLAFKLFIFPTFHNQGYLVVSLFR